MVRRYRPTRQQVQDAFEFYKQCYAIPKEVKIVALKDRNAQQELLPATNTLVPVETVPLTDWERMRRTAINGREWFPEDAEVRLDKQDLVNQGTLFFVTKVSNLIEGKEYPSSVPGQQRVRSFFYIFTVQTRVGTGSFALGANDARQEWVAKFKRAGSMPMGPFRLNIITMKDGNEYFNLVAADQAELLLDDAIEQDASIPF